MKTTSNLFLAALFAAAAIFQSLFYKGDVNIVIPVLPFIAGAVVFSVLNQRKFKRRYGSYMFKHLKGMNKKVPRFVNVVTIIMLIGFLVLVAYVKPNTPNQVAMFLSGLTGYSVLMDMFVYAMIRSSRDTHPPTKKSSLVMNFRFHLGAVIIFILIMIGTMFSLHIFNGLDIPMRPFTLSSALLVMGQVGMLMIFMLCIVVLISFVESIRDLSKRKVYSKISKAKARMDEDRPHLRNNRRMHIINALWAIGVKPDMDMLDMSTDELYDKLQMESRLSDMKMSLLFDKNRYDKE